MNILTLEIWSKNISYLIENKFWKAIQKEISKLSSKYSEISKNVEIQQYFTILNEAVKAVENGTSLEDHIEFLKKNLPPKKQFAYRIKYDFIEDYDEYAMQKSKSR